MTKRVIDPADIPVTTRAVQKRAADPSLSLWVSANAGSGKTHVLTERVIRLLLDDADPANILCVTYTRAAAANMANRVFARLAEWTTMPETDLRKALTAILHRAPDAGEMKKARRLFARALETPGGLKIQTIHAFCEAILHQFPLEANIAGHFELMDDKTSALLAASASRRLLTPQEGIEPRELDRALALALDLAGEHGLRELIDAIIGEREDLKKLIEHLRGLQDEDVDGFPALFEIHGIEPETSETDIVASAWPLPGFSKAETDRICDAVERHDAGKTQAVIDALRAAHKTGAAAERLAQMQTAFLTQKGTPRASPFKKAVLGELPWLSQAFADAADEVLKLANAAAFMRMLKGTEAALVIAENLVAGYEAEKQARGLMDFDDLIERTVALLSRQDVGAWVRYKLDKGIEHILVDEAQDTSPEQWQVLTGLAEEFFAGETASNRQRTVFAVGDEKQSIYSFQGARPESFAEQRRHFTTQARSAGKPFETEELHTSFRSAPDILSAVDAVFAQPAAHAGLSQIAEPTVHTNLARMGPGEVQVWDMILPEAVEDDGDWTREIDHASEPAIRLAERIARTVKDWTSNGEMLAAKGRPIGAGDIMVLVRKRGPFIHALARRLKDLDVDVAGTDRIHLAAHIGVQDLLALGRFCLQPADDLSLAALLRSPVFDVSEDSLMTIAIGRPKGEPLIGALRRHARDDARLAAIVMQLDAWKAQAGILPVFDFYAGILSRDGVRAKLIGRLGREAEDLLDEFLKFALAEEKAGPPGLDIFLQSMETVAPEIKREMDQARDEVRIMTVHAAKGLEAPVVFLVDPGSAPSSHSHLPVLVPTVLPDGHTRSFFWRFKDNKPDERALLDDELKRRMEDEYRRLLYVGMTRAEDRLIVCGYGGSRPANESWLTLVQSGLSPSAERRTNHALGFDYWHYAPSGAEPGERAKAADQVREQVEAPPAHLFAQARAEQGPPRPLAPSGASLLIEELEGETVPSTASPVLDAREAETSAAIERGLAMHRLLQVLPDLEPDERSGAAARYLALRLPEWEEARCTALADEALAILEDGRFAPVFAPGSQAEVPVMGLLEIGGQTRAVSGIIDRLAVDDGRVLIVDYKTNRPVPRSIEAVPQAYGAQLALYAELLKPLYPGRRIEAALLFTAGPVVLGVSESVMDGALAALSRK